MYLLGQIPAEETEVVRDRRTVMQGALLAGLLITGFWAYLKLQPKVTLKSGYPHKAVRRNPSRRRKPMTLAHRIAKAQTRIELMKLENEKPQKIARAITRLELLKMQRRA